MTGRSPRHSRRAALQSGAALVATSALGVGRSRSAPPAVEPRIEYLENESLRVGIDLAIGGSIVHLSSVARKTNLINSHDWGRQVQMSHYAAPVPFEPRGERPADHWKDLGWNPVQSGDAFGHPSEVLSFQRTRDSLVVRTRPLHWPLENEPAQCVFESRLTLEGNLLRAVCRIECDRTDDPPAVPRDQELPAAYTNGPFHRLLTYEGEEPFSGGRLTEIPKRGPDEGWRRFWATERWAALVNDDGFGLGVLSPETTLFLGGFSGRPGSGGARDAPCGYVAPIRQETLDARIRHEYRYALAIGTIDEIRAAARREFAAARSAAWSFGPGRDGWNAKQASDAGYPLPDAWSIVPTGDDPQIVGPPTFWRAERFPRLRIEAACEGAGNDARVFAYPLGQGPPASTTFSLEPDGPLQRVDIDLAGAKGYSGALTSLRIDPPAGCERFTLRRIELVEA